MSLELTNSTESFEAEPESTLENQPFGPWGLIFVWALRCGGFISNCIVLDVLQSLQKPGSSLLWAKYQVIWGNIFVTQRIITGATGFLLSLDVENVSRLSCKAFTFLDIFLFFTTFSHSVGFFLDKALFLKYTAWHYSQNWKNILLKCSTCLVAFNLLCFSPLLAASDIQEKSCDVTSMIIFISVFGIVCAIFIIVIAVSNAVFITELRNYRMKQKKEKDRAKVTCSVSKTTEEKVSGDNITISISSARTESRPETETFQFSDEEMKAVKFLLFW